MDRQELEEAWHLWGNVIWHLQQRGKQETQWLEGRSKWFRETGLPHEGGDLGGWRLEKEALEGLFCHPDENPCDLDQGDGSANGQRWGALINTKNKWFDFELKALANCLNVEGKVIRGIRHHTLFYTKTQTFPNFDTSEVGMQWKSLSGGLEAVSKGLLLPVYANTACRMVSPTRKRHPETTMGHPLICPITVLDGGIVCTNNDLESKKFRSIELNVKNI